MDHHLLSIIVCPICFGKLHFDNSQQELVCKVDQLAYPIHQGIPVLLENKARHLATEEKK